MMALYSLHVVTSSDDQPKQDGERCAGHDGEHVQGDGFGDGHGAS